MRLLPQSGICRRGTSPEDDHMGGRTDLRDCADSAQSSRGIDEGRRLRDTVYRGDRREGTVSVPGRGSVVRGRTDVRLLK